MDFLHKVRGGVIAFQPTVKSTYLVTVYKGGWIRSWGDAEQLTGPPHR